MSSLSSIILNDPETVQIDRSGKSIAYFCKKSPAKVNTGLIVELKEIALGFGSKNIRLCLHENPGANFHSMIILEHKGRYYRPHKHLTKGETFHIIEGSMGAFVFDEHGDIVDACVLEACGDFIYRVGVNIYHAVMPLSELVVYHESKPGPFLAEKDSIYPSWSPDGNNVDEVAEFMNRLLRTLQG